MKKIILITLLLLSVADVVVSQYNSRPSRSRFYNNKMSTFTIKTGDILVYTIDSSGQQSNLTVAVKKFGSYISLDYLLPGKSSSGQTTLEPQAVTSATVYGTGIAFDTRSFKDTSIFWLSRKNYNDLVTLKETTMDVGNGRELFRSGRVITMRINFKGKEKIVTAFDIENINTGSKKELVILSEENNPLILKTNFGMGLTLKEVR